MNRFLPLILASRSPRRADLLRAAGIPFEVRVADVDEAIKPAEDPESYVRRVADAKALAVSSVEPARVVVAADTVVVVDAKILGKPADAADATRMLGLLSGRTHLVLTGVRFICPFRADNRDAKADGRDHASQAAATHVEATTVEFARLTRQELEWYVSSGEPMDKAGAYAIQGLASRFVTRIVGSYSNVVGLPVPILYQMCREAGILIS